MCLLSLVAIRLLLPAFVLSHSCQFCGHHPFSVLIWARFPQKRVNFTLQAPFWTHFRPECARLRRLVAVWAHFEEKCAHLTISHLFWTHFSQKCDYFAAFCGPLDCGSCVYSRSRAIPNLLLSANLQTLDCCSCFYSRSLPYTGFVPWRSLFAFAQIRGHR